MRYPFHADLLINAMRTSALMDAMGITVYHSMQLACAYEWRLDQ